jgi:hypothetical protein
MGTDGYLDLDNGGKSIDRKAYRSMIGSLLYLYASRPDIMLSVCMCARFQSNPKECHCRRFETGGSLSRRVSVLRAPAQMGRARGRARRGERRGGWSRA